MRRWVGALVPQTFLVTQIQQWHLGMERHVPHLQSVLVHARSEFHHMELQGHATKLYLSVLEGGKQHAPRVLAEFPQRL